MFHLENVRQNPFRADIRVTDQTRWEPVKNAVGSIKADSRKENSPEIKHTSIILDTESKTLDILCKKYRVVEEKCNARLPRTVQKSDKYLVHSVASSEGFGTFSDEPLGNGAPPYL